MAKTDRALTGRGMFLYFSFLAGLTPVYILRPWLRITVHYCLAHPLFVFAPWHLLFFPNLVFYCVQRLPTFSHLTWQH